MIKLVYLTDTHVRANSPSSRLDFFPETIIKKLTWVGEYANSVNADAIIHGGDWLDRWDATYSIIRDLIKVVLKWDKKVYTVLGNHDISGYNAETFQKTAIGVLEAAGFIQRLESKPVLIKGSNETVSLTGADASSDVDDKLKYYTDVAGESDHIKIHIVHGFLSNISWPDYVKHTLISNIVETKADIILTGHEHKGFGLIEKNNKLFCNPGALARVTAGLGDINQVVKVALITINGSDFNIELVPLPKSIALPADKVLDRSKIKEEKERVQNLETFKSKMDGFQFTSFNIYKILEEIKAQESIEENVVKLTKEKLEIAESEIAEEEKSNVRE